MYYAHTTEDGHTENWEDLADHLIEVAKRAQEFAAVFGAAEYGYFVGLIHDLGKIKETFQKKLHGQRNGEPHAGEGAKYADLFFGKS